MSIYLRGVEIARWEMRRDRLLAVNSNPKPGDLPGQETREPAFDSPAKWITPDLQAQAIAAGYAVVDHTSVLAAHLSELIKHNAHDLLTRHETKRLIDRLADSHPKLVDELIPKLMTLGEVQKVLQQLLREQVSIRDLGTILEALVETAAINKNPVILVEAARHALGRALIRPLLDESGQLKVVTLDSAIEEECCPHSSQAPAARRGRGAADFCGAQGTGWTARHARRSDCDGSSRASVRFAGPVLSPAGAGTVYSQDRCDFSIGDPSDDPGDVVRVGAMKMLNAISFHEVTR